MLQIEGDQTEDHDLQVDGKQQVQEIQEGGNDENNAQTQEDGLEDIDSIVPGISPADAIVKAVAAVLFAHREMPDQENDDIGDHQGNEEGDPDIQPQTGPGPALEQLDDLPAGAEDFVQDYGQHDAEGQERDCGALLLTAHGRVLFGFGTLEALEEIHGQKRLNQAGQQNEQSDDGKPAEHLCVKEDGAAAGNRGAGGVQRFHHIRNSHNQRRGGGLHLMLDSAGMMIAVIRCAILQTANTGNSVYRNFIARVGFFGKRTVGLDAEVVNACGQSNVTVSHIIAGQIADGGEFAVGKVSSGLSCPGHTGGESGNGHLGFVHIGQIFQLFSCGDDVIPDILAAAGLQADGQGLGITAVVSDEIGLSLTGEVNQHDCIAPAGKLNAIALHGVGIGGRTAQHQNAGHGSVCGGGLRRHQNGTAGILGAVGGIGEIETLHFHFAPIAGIAPYHCNGEN